MFNHPDTCPVCQTKPYPRAVACQSCGFVGQDWDDFQKLRANIWRLWPIVVGTLIFMMVLPIILLIIFL